MKSAVATRFRCRRPSTDLEQGATMFLTLILQYLNKLVEGKVGDFASPQAFHTRKVQRFNGDCVELLTEFGGELPLKVFALVGYFPIQTCDLSYTPPPTIRTFLFSRKTFVERPKFVQGVFQRLGVLFLLTRAQGQVCVFHAGFGLGIDQIHSLYYIVCPDTLTRRWQRLCFYKVREYIEPIITTRVTLYRDTADISFKLTVLMQRIRNFIMSPFTSVPFSEIEGETIVIQKPARLFECEGFKLVPFLDFRSTAKFLEKTDIRLVNTFQFFLDCLTRQRIPMRVRRAFQLGYVRAHRSMVRIGQSVFISLTVPFMEILVDLRHIVKQVAKPNTIGLIIKRIFVGFHGISHITPLPPIEWVGRHVTLRLRSICLPV